MSRHDALKIAEEAGVDLVEISPTANPPVAKVIDWGKFQYQKMKEQQKNRKSSKAGELKQMRFGLKIGSGDLDIKLRKSVVFSRMVVKSVSKFFTVAARWPIKNLASL